MKSVAKNLYLPSDSADILGRLPKPSLAVAWLLRKLEGSKALQAELQQHTGVELKAKV